MLAAVHKLTSWQLDGPNGQVTVYTFTKGQTIWASDGADTWVFHLAHRIKQDTEEQTDGKIRAQMSATVSQIIAQDGDKVTAGDRLIVLEAMKMEQPVLAPADGQIEKLRSMRASQSLQGRFYADSFSRVRIWHERR
ncbi:MAG: hypothetical protein CM15mP100_4550 [Alphaproteobacteria bacterium]|nr:MAG: hypothetical protein CM15mP100_4550 [Alphaproteobacteria bacterium]